MPTQDVFVVSHRTNSLNEIGEALARGANGIECDVHRSTVNHGPHFVSTSLINWLKEAARQAEANPQFAVIYFDVKAPAYVRDICWCVRDYLPETLASIYVVDDFARRQDLSYILETARPTEGIAFDNYTNQDEIAGYLNSHPATNAWFSYGRTDGDIDAMLPILDRAVAVSRGRRCCAWTLSQRSAVARAMDHGIDALLVDRGALGECLQEVRARNAILAGRDRVFL